MAMGPLFRTAARDASRGGWLLSAIRGQPAHIGSTDAGLSLDLATCGLVAGAKYGDLVDTRGMAGFILKNKVVVALAFRVEDLSGAATIQSMHDAKTIRRKRL